LFFNEIFRCGAQLEIDRSFILLVSHFCFLIGEEPKNCISTAIGKAIKPEAAMEKWINLKIKLKQQSSVLSKVPYFHEEGVKK